MFDVIEFQKNRSKIANVLGRIRLLFTVRDARPVCKWQNRYCVRLNGMNREQDAERGNIRCLHSFGYFSLIFGLIVHCCPIVVDHYWTIQLYLSNKLNKITTETSKGHYRKFWKCIYLSKHFWVILSLTYLWTYLYQLSTLWQLNDVKVTERHYYHHHQQIDGISAHIFHRQTSGQQTASEIFIQFSEKKSLN